jgi:hypothetical protein
MQFKKWLLTSISLIVLYLCLWGMIWASAQLKNHPNDELSNFLPENTKFAVRIYSDNILKSFFQELLCYKADDSAQIEIENYIEKVISQADKDDESSKNLSAKLKGIDLYNDLIVFQFYENENEYTGLLCHVTDSLAFNDFDTKNKFIYRSSNNSVGLILQSDRDQSNSLKQIAKKVLSVQKFKKLCHKRLSSEALADVYIKINDENKSSLLTLAINGNDKKINVNGKIVSGDFKIDNNPVYVLQGKNLSVNLRYIPEPLKKQIRNWLAQNKIPDIDLKELQMNYEGLDIELTPTNIAIKPRFEAIVKTKNGTKIKNYLSNTVVLEKIGGELDSNYISINNSKYYFEQLDSSTFYIGNNSKPVYEKRLNPDLMSMRGSLSHLTNIQTGGMDFLLNVVPLYAAANRYFLNSEKLNFKITHNAKMNTIEGNLDFKTGRNAFFESFFLFLEIQEVNTLLK